jgi:protein associated with RNAse G/E
VIGRPIEIRGTTYDGALHWSHPAYLVLQRAKLIVTQTFAGLEVQTRRGPWASPFDTRGHYWTDRWYNVIRLHNPRGQGLFGYYCNIATPAEFDGENLQYCDPPNRRPRLCRGWRLAHGSRRRDEFEEARERLLYPVEVVDNARSAVEDLQRLIRARSSRSMAEAREPPRRVLLLWSSEVMFDEGGVGRTLTDLLAAALSDSHPESRWETQAHGIRDGEHARNAFALAQRVGPDVVPLAQR